MARYSSILTVKRFNFSLSLLILASVCAFARSESQDDTVASNLSTFRVSDTSIRP